MPVEAATRSASACSVYCLSKHPEAAVSAAVDAVFTDPQIAPLISHDHRQPGYVLHPCVRYLCAVVDGKLAGIFMLIDITPIDVEIHAALLPWAVRQSRLLGQACLAHVFRDPEVKRASTQVMDDLGTALNYCLKVGMRREGFKPDACSKRGRLVGVHLLGITRQQWELLQ